VGYDAGDGGDGEERGRGGGKEKRTTMRMTWNGPGHPLSMLLWVQARLRGVGRLMEVGVGRTTRKAR